MFFHINRYLLYYNMGINLRDLPKKGHKIAPKSDLQLKEVSDDLLQHPLNDSRKLAENIVVKPTKIKVQERTEEKCMDFLWLCKPQLVWWGHIS